TYTVTLIASINGGCSDQVTKQITVNEGPKTCDFASETDYASSFFGMKMDAIDNNGVPMNQSGVTYTWVIEGGGNKAGSSISHDFKKDGVYEVTMVARVDATGCECSRTRTVVMSRGAVEDLSSAGVSVFPNPNSGKFQIALTETFGSNVKVEVMSATGGATVQSINSQNTGLLSIDGGNLADGMYLVRVSSGDNVATRWISVRH
ncbi:MAG: T9SS type A sorting domain-containing protein, partial [Bacteroidetes bacterium]|nr:T9SS type A sorting domain-containing protein [Bacteroidota bacterium]